jgi:hypothetical protein
VVGCGLDSSGSRYGPVTGSYERVNESSGSVREGEFIFQQLSGIGLGCELDDLTFGSGQGLGIFFFTIASRPALGPT